MFVLITYDVSTIDKEGRRRLRKMARACQDYGQRVQNSVFEIKVGAKDWALLKDRLLKIVCEEEDSLRFYRLDQDVEIDNYGKKVPVDFEAPLIL